MNGIRYWLGLLAYALFTNFLSLYVAFVLTLPCLYLVVVVEERELEDRFPDEWREYAARVPRFLPAGLPRSRRPA